MGGVNIIDMVTKVVPLHLFIKVLIIIFILYIISHAMERIINEEHITGRQVILLAILTLLLFKSPNISETVYRVEVDPAVNFVDFTCKYDVIKKNDDGTWFVKPIPYE